MFWIVLFVSLDSNAQLLQQPNPEVLHAERVDALKIKIKEEELKRAVMMKANLQRRAKFEKRQRQEESQLDGK